MQRNSIERRTDDRTVETTSEGGTPAPSSRGEIDAFLAKASTAPKPGAGRGRVIFALDATMSRQPTWDRAMHIQSSMFETARRLGTLDVQLVYFRGFRECRASRWVADGGALGSLMERVDCRGGHTQIGKVLAHALREKGRDGVSAVVFVGDAMEENPDALCQRAGELGLRGVPCFMFHEGRDGAAGRTFKEIARLSGGAYARFDSGAAGRLKELLEGVAAFSTGGREALERLGSEGSRLLLEQMRR